jgi:predicted DNA-binding ribbon-helix-helix protein
MPLTCCGWRRRRGGRWANVSRPRTSRYRRRVVRLHTEEWQALDRLAHAQDLSTNALIRRFLKRALESDATKREVNHPRDC